MSQSLYFLLNELFFFKNYEFSLKEYLLLYCILLLLMCYGIVFITDVCYICYAVVYH